MWWCLVCVNGTTVYLLPQSYYMGSVWTPRLCESCAGRFFFFFPLMFFFLISFFLSSAPVSHHLSSPLLTSHLFVLLSFFFSPFISHVSLLIFFLPQILSAPSAWLVVSFLPSFLMSPYVSHRFSSPHVSLLLIFDVSHLMSLRLFCPHGCFNF